MNRFLELIKRKPLIWYLDALSLGAVLQYAAFRFLQSTMFSFYYSDMYKMITMVLLLVFGGIRYVYLIIRKLKLYSEKKDRIHFLLRCAFAWFLALPFFYVGWKHNYKILIFLPICCMCLYDMEAGKILRAFAFTIGILLAATILCCLSGTVRNLVKASNDGQIYGAFGIINTTDFASYFTFLLLIVWCGICNHKWYISILLAAISAAISWIVFTYTDSRTALFCGALIVLFILWDCIEENILRKKTKIRHIDKCIDWFTALAFPLIGITVIILTKGYGQQNQWAVELDTNILTGRLSAIWESYQQYGIQPFGSLITAAHGKGGTIIPYWSSGYGYLDIAYAMMAIKNGWIVTGIITFLWVWMTIRAFRSGNLRISSAMAILAFHAFSEARILDVNYNIFLVMPFCVFKESQKDSLPSLDRNHRISVCSGAIILIGMYLFLPRMLSWLRTIFSGKRWNAGIGAFNSLIICVCIVVFFIVLWKIISLLIYKHNRNTVIAMITVCFLGAGTAMIANNTIEQEIHFHKTRLDKEESVFNLVRESATLPVYAAEPSELYMRKFEGVSDHLFSTEELGRFPKGSILTDVNVESLSITLNGGMYTRISDDTGLYTYDNDVIDVLKRAGYEWTPFYSGERNINLADMAVFNNRCPGESIELNSNERVITSNIEIDQIKGYYDVCFDLSEYPDSCENSEIILEVVGENDEKLIYQETLSAEDFDLDRHCNHTMTYAIDTTPKVSFSIKTGNNTHVKINKISWKQFMLVHTDGVKIQSDDSFVMQTSRLNNFFNLVQLQLFNANNGEYLLSFGAGNECGNVSGKFVNELDAGAYYLVFRGNTNHEDEWIKKLIRLDRGSTIQYNYQIDEMKPDCVKISNFVIAVNGEHTQFFE